MEKKEFKFENYLIGKIKKIEKKIDLLAEHLGLKFEEKKEIKIKGLEMYPSAEEILKEKLKETK